jgi:hypothetical protein
MPFSHRLSGHFRILHPAWSWETGLEDFSGHVAIRDRYLVSGVDVNSLKETWTDVGWYSFRNAASGEDTVLVLEGSLHRPMGEPLTTGFDGRSDLTVVIPRRGGGFEGAFAGFGGAAHGYPHGFPSFDGAISVDEASPGPPRTIRLEGSFRAAPGFDKLWYKDQPWYTHLCLSLRSEIPSAVIPLESYHALFSDDPLLVEAEVARRGGVRGVPQRIFPFVLHSLAKVEGERARRLLIEACRFSRDPAPWTALGYLQIRGEAFQEREVLEEVRSAFGLYHEDVDGYVLFVLEKCGVPRGEELERLVSSSDTRVLRSALRYIWDRGLELVSGRPELVDGVRGLKGHSDPIVAGFSRTILARLLR